MPTRFHIGIELVSAFGGGKRMKPHVPNWPVTLKGLRRMWDIGEETELECSLFVCWINKKNKLE